MIVRVILCLVELDYEGMVDAAKMLSGEEHNYEWMCVIQEGELRNTRRTVHLNIETVPVKVNGNDTMIPYFLQQNENSVVHKVVATSDFFLYKMVRRIVGLLVAIGKKQADLTTMKRCIGVYDKYGAASDDREGESMKIPVKLQRDFVWITLSTIFRYEHRLCTGIITCARWTAKYCSLPAFVLVSVGGYFLVSMQYQAGVGQWMVALTMRTSKAMQYERTRNPKTKGNGQCIGIKQPDVATSFLSTCPPSNDLTLLRCILHRYAATISRRR